MNKLKIAIINNKKCKPDKCNYECKTACPIEKRGKECINITDIEDILKPGIKQKQVKIVEDSCISCGLCVKACPFGAIHIVNIPSEITDKIIHRYNKNGFRLYSLPIMKPNNIIGLLGPNGIGKTTILQIISKNIKPNFEDFTKEYNDKDLITQFKGSENHKFMKKLYNNELNISVKIQHVELLTAFLSQNNKNPTVLQYILRQTGLQNLDDEYTNDIITTLELDQILDSKVISLSGGELQRIICAITLLKEADLYIFDEISNFLDIKQRLNMAKLIRKITHKYKDKIKYVIVIEHDIALLDYMADNICIMYGVPGAYGVISKPYSTKQAINIFFEGYIPSQNLRFRTEEYDITDINLIDNNVCNMNTNTDIFNYDSSLIQYEKFNLTIEGGKFPSESCIILICGENGTGKTTLIKYLDKILVTELNMGISIKKQFFNLSELNDNMTVEDFLNTTIREAYNNHMFNSDVIQPLNIESIKDRLLKQLSGGELQKVLIIYCLGTPAQIYLIDEPSSCLDVEQRVIITKVIKKFIIHNKKIAFVVEHDMMMAINLARDINSKIIVMEKTVDENKIRNCIAHPPTLFSIGINKFLQNLDITFRTPTEIDSIKMGKIPRINKKGSQKDQEQKITGEYWK
jgi:ATP-binding cassette subfamily E protein 1